MILQISLHHALHIMKIYLSRYFSFLPSFVRLPWYQHSNSS